MCVQTGPTDGNVCRPAQLHVLILASAALRLLPHKEAALLHTLVCNIESWQARACAALADVAIVNAKVRRAANRIS